MSLQIGIGGLVMALSVTACGEDKAQTPAEAEKGAAEYKARVDKTVSESVVNSLVREWNISEEQARCLLADHRASQLGRVGSDPAVQAAFEKCGVDTSVAK